MAPVGARNETDAVSVASLYRGKLFAIIEQFLGEMDKRFSKNDDILNAVAACDPTNPSFLSSELLTNVAVKYSSVLNINISHLNAQLQVARRMILDTKSCRIVTEVNRELSKMLSAFPDVLALLKLMAIIPMTSASAERSFSAMKRIKTHLRASMAPTRTSDITLIAVEHDLSKLLLQDPSSVINEFATKGQRRIAFL
jgi:L-lactate utilization protein LutC